jgi:Fe-S cluster biogenesis protein NfuA
MENNKEDITQKVQNVITQIRPYLQQDGGDIEFIELTDDNIVNVRLLGACGSCPYSTMTLKNGVETAMKKAIPEIISVEAVNLEI